MINLYHNIKMKKRFSSPIILIPARMGSKRLPGKPLLDIAGAPMIVQVWRRAMESKVGPVVVACDGEEIAAVVRKTGGLAVVTKPSHPTGSDRIWDALNKFEKKTGKRFDTIINVQGDLPVLDPGAIRAAYDLLRDPEIDIGTLAVEIGNEKDKHAGQIVKAVIDMPQGAKKGRALYFSRLPAPAGEGPMYHHIGLYAYKRPALAKFVNAAPSALEKRESLEQLRALALGLTIGVAVIDAVPLGVDTKADLAVARRLLGRKKG
jgi:3-deoxy-manno-octulosonate cytidylyltransferase (CMP-KDO synthetase)